MPTHLILSRKGFDAGYGGMPSPILPDGRLLPLPIPSAHDSFRLRDVHAPGVDLRGLLRDLGRGRHVPATRVHLDPDLDRKPSLRLPGWRPSLGQTGAAQAHLAGQGVGPGAVFLFFGWFREVARQDGRWRWARGAPHLHVLFGWLEVEEVLPIVSERARCLARHPWTADHPHMANPRHYSDARNTLYIAPERSARMPGHPGGGLFRHYHDALRLSCEQGPRSRWRLPAWFMPKPGRAALSYHADPARWTRHGRHCLLRTVAKGQEFVLDANHRRTRDWIAATIHSGTTPAPPL
ncbi:MAG TPA: hypothetical protein VFG21_00830 [Xanthomonadaceae bacterium]|nr:hypothetical protein [Xanthomonadaceae bacterium]